MVESPQNHMEDRQIDLSDIPSQVIQHNKLEFLLDDEYIVPEGIFLYEDEAAAFQQASDSVYDIFKAELDDIVTKKDFNFLKLPSEVIDLIIHSHENIHRHLLGRFDFSGGIDGLPIKLLEFNADMPTLLPESITIQNGFNPIMGGKPYSELERRLEVAFSRLPKVPSDKNTLMLGTSFGNPEDVANMKILLDLANAEGFATQYADLPEIEFAQNEGVFTETEDGSYYQFDYLLKLIPWEFICFEEPGLLADLHNLILRGLITVMNPAYTMVYQAKAFLVRLAEKYPSDYLLKTTLNPKAFAGDNYVRKANFGRLGENISIFNGLGNVVEETDGDLDLTNCIYQEFAELYKDNYGEYYQPGVYNVFGKAAGLSFRRADKLIVDNDCQFIPHILRK